jgi:endonuclease-8
VWRALQRRATAIGASLLDQSVVAGVGNVYRAEVLFVCGIAPQRPSRDLSREEFDRVWTTLLRMLRDGVRDGKIITVDPAELGISKRRMTLEDWRYVYRRTDLPCRRCATPIVQWELGARQMYACPVCQPDGVAK